MANIERLTALLEYVEKLPVERIYMGVFRNNYGTAACLMGHAVTVFPGQLEWTRDDYLGMPRDPMAQDEASPGRTFFDLTLFQWNQIFNSDIPDEEAVSNLREHIKEWERAAN